MTSIRKTGATKAILNALIKYGFESFTLVLFIMPEISREELLQLEQSVLNPF